MSSIKTRLAKLEAYKLEREIRKPKSSVKDMTDEELFFIIFPDETEYRELTEDELNAIIKGIHNAENPGSCVWKIEGHYPWLKVG